MKENKLTIRINAPASEVFAFAINPENTPKWIDSIREEKVDELPVKQGSIYKNTNNGEEWSEYVVSHFKEHELFELTDKNSSYKVKYTFTPISENKTELEYFEWMEDGELSNPFTIEALEKLKSLMEK